jgi:phosphatidylinositol kinase/protein kinase (PI-3  family)
LQSNSTAHTIVTEHGFSEKMRTAAILLAQLQTLRSPSSSTLIGDIRNRIIQEMTNLEVQRLTAIAAHSINITSQTELGNQDLSRDIGIRSKQTGSSILAKEDPSAIVFQEAWQAKVERIRKDSVFGARQNWKLLSVIVKADSDLRQEQLALQIISEMQRIWELENVPAWVYYYRVLVTGTKGGLIETITDSISVHSIKKQAMYKQSTLSIGSVPHGKDPSAQSNISEPSYSSYTLLYYFISRFGTMDSENFKQAQRSFMLSLVGYSMVTWILAVKDRHNGNILVDRYGHLIHIDFGFMLSNSPGYVGFETAPFKLTMEYIELLGGMTSDLFLEFKSLLLRAFIALRKHSDNIILMIEMMMKDSKLPCFYSGEAAIQHLRERFQLGLTESQLSDMVDRMVASSSCNMFTRLYDTFQYYSNGIL